MGIGVKGCVERKGVRKGEMTLVMGKRVMGFSEGVHEKRKSVMGVCGLVTEEGVKERVMVSTEIKSGDGVSEKGRGTGEGRGERSVMGVGEENY